MELANATWPEIDSAQRSGIIIPLGSTEQHGPHLPFDTDTRIADHLARRAAGETGVAVAPALAYGASGEHADFPGTLSIGTEALTVVIVELVRSASASFDWVLIANGHGGNHPAVRSAVDQMGDEGHRVRAWWPMIPGGDAHAGHTETSLMLAIDPARVRLDRSAAGAVDPLAELLPRLRAEGVRSVASNGVLGDPAGASPHDGAALLDRLVGDLVDVVRRWGSPGEARRVPAWR